MILVVPSIELENGACKQCIVGEAGSETLYRNMACHPEKLVRLLRRENAKALHLVDVDTIKSPGVKINYKNILSIPEAVDIPIQLQANFQSVEDCAFFLENGIYRVAPSELLLKDSQGAASLVKEFTPSRVIFALSCSESKEAPDIVGLAGLAKKAGATRVLVDCRKNVYGGASDEKIIARISDKTKLRITLFEGVSSPEQLWRLKEFNRYGVDSVVIGKALYDNRFPCQKIWRMVEAELEPKLI